MVEIKRKAEHYCAFQERSHQEVRNKLYEWGLYGSEVEKMITELIQEDFLNEERFAIAYTLGKFRMKKWGRFKIRRGLKLKSVSEPLIRLSMKQIDEAEYLSNLETLLVKKNELLHEKDDFKRYHKLLNYALGKGYEADLIRDVLKVLLNPKDL